MNRYHCCATCIHFRAERVDGKMRYMCKRLGYETKTHYKFNCWTPKEKVRRLMEKQGEKDA
ncbi:hypothetical protein ACFSCZ_15045 [Siminovitchia sediminis]|uniref:Uncharacterized protein n=1 Tax=Siminovitchia sediminis TaxID=1274353 RepID=A0ABW4KP70_9BACI